jgi:hypothetical protein
MTMKIAKEWFRANPRNVVSFHWRWNELPPGVRERLSLPRTATVIGHRVVFACPYAGRSEVALSGVNATVTESCELQLFDSVRHFVSYRGAA